MDSDRMDTRRNFLDKMLKRSALVGGASVIATRSSVRAETAGGHPLPGKVSLAPQSHRYLAISDHIFAGNTAAIEVVEDLYTPTKRWERPLAEWPGWSADGNGGWYYHLVVPKMAEGAYELEVSARPGEREVNLQATLKNTGTQTWRKVVGEVCLNCRSFLWLDNEGERMFIFTKNGKLPLSEAVYISRPNRRRHLYHTFEENRRMLKDGWEFSWGYPNWAYNGLTLEPITEGLIVAVGDGFGNDRIYLGLAWDRVAYLWTNFSNCIHNSPMFGDLAPGEKSTRQGKIYISEDLDSIVARYQQDFPGRGRL